jgi:alpha-L-fucosidase
LIFSDVGPDIRWIGNEHGIAGFTNWSKISTAGMEIGDANTGYLNTGDPAGTQWLVGECDVSIRPGWFYHASQDSLVKSPDYLVNLYYKSVGRNGTLLLNLPPDQRGLIHENDIQSLREFRSILDESFRENLIRGAGAKVSSQWASGEKFSPENLLDGETTTYWAASPDDEQPLISIQLEKEEVFDRLMLQEPIRFGQRIVSFSIEARVNAQWKMIAEGTTIGYKRLLRFDPVKTRQLRIRISESQLTPALADIGVFKASNREKIYPEKER